MPSSVISLEKYETLLFYFGHMPILTNKYHKYMPRKKRCRRIDMFPEVTFYKPAGIPILQLDITEIGLDEFEAMRLADMEGLYHSEAASRMNISRQTFGRIIHSARYKIASAFVEGRGLRFGDREKSVITQ